MNLLGATDLLLDEYKIEAIDGFIEETHVELHLCDSPAGLEKFIVLRQYASESDGEEPDVFSCTLEQLEDIVRRYRSH